jgi:hypothetical protein
MKNQVPEQLFLLVMRQLEIQRDIDLLEIQELFNRPVDKEGTRDRIERIISRTKLALDSEQAINFLKEYFTQETDEKNE